ncbi:MAG: hypothetical protein IKQ95_00650, partial [Synergistaceae bacterium]|nr:hypothetical protein [Synergistaceae bacterium]
MLRRLTLFTAFFITMSAGMAFADYQFDDLQGPSGVSTQWMVINDTGETFGASYSEAVRISADLLSSGTARLDVISGNSNTTVNDRNLQTFFLVLSNGAGQFDMSMKSQAIAFDVSTPNLGVNTIVNENMTPYIDTKTADQSGNDTAEWKTFHFNIARQNDRNKYDTVIQSFMFQQNPDRSPSQAITRPMVISNVYPGTAQSSQAPLIVRMTL